MNRLEMRTKLGMSASASGKQVDNAAIRAWCKGGPELLDLMHELHQLKETTRWSGSDPAIEAALRNLGVARENMLDAIHKNRPLQ